MANCALADDSPWFRIPYNNTLTSDPVLNNTIRATAKLIARDGSSGQQGTAFYLGKFNGQHLMMTNFHVMPAGFRECREGAKVYFEMDKPRTFKCTSIIATFPDIETVFFAIHVSKDDEYLFENRGLKFDFQKSYKPGDRLVTAGYGYYKNNKSRLTYENSETCLVVSDPSFPLFMKADDPEVRKTFNAWSFAHSCATSHGDSGSALVSEDTGKVMGLNWAATVRPDEIIKSKTSIFDWIQNKNPLMWSNMSYGVPNKYILMAINKKNNSTLNEFLESNLQQGLAGL